MYSIIAPRLRRLSITAIIFTTAVMSLPTSATILHAQTAPLTPAAKLVDSARVEIDAAMQADDMARLERIVGMLDRALVAFPQDAYLLHYRGYANYRRIVHMFRSNDMQQAGPLLVTAISDLQQSSTKLQWAETYSLLATLQGIRIVVDPSLGQDLVAELGSLSEEASRLGPNNPRVLLMAAYAAQNTPAEYGGGLDKARALAERARAAFATDKPGPLAPAWGKEDADKLLKTLPSGLQ